MTSRLKGVTRQVRLTVQCWWLNRDVDRLARQIYKGLDSEAVAVDARRVRVS